jgi:hypothetical protein
LEKIFDLWNSICSALGEFVIGSLGAELELGVCKEVELVGALKTDTALGLEPKPAAPPPLPAYIH